MKKFQRMMAALICMLLVVSTSAGCGGQKAPAPTAAETKEKATAAQPAAREKIRFAFWDMTTGAKEFTSIVEAFNKESKTVEVEPIALQGTDYIDKIAIMLAAGEDVDGLTIKDLTQYSGCILKHQLAPLDELVAKASFDLKPYGANVDVLKKDGKIMAVPYRLDFYILFYNKDIFDKAKEPYPTDDTTWDWFKATAKKLTSGSGNDKIWGAYFHTWENTVADICTATRKGDLVSGKFDYLKPAYEMVLAMEQDDKSAMTLAAAKTSKAHYKAMFESGKVAMHVIGTWHIGQLIGDKKAGTTTVNWGVAKAPHFADNKPGTTIGNLTPVAITTSSKKAASTYEFIQFMAGTKGAKILGQMGLMPGYQSKEILDTIANLDGFPKENKSALDTVDIVQQLLPHKNAAQMKKILGEENDLMLTKAGTIDQGLKKLNDRTKELAADNE